MLRATLRRCDEDVKGVRTYRAVVVPWLWFLTQTTDCRIFQEMTVVEIIEKGLYRPWFLGL